MATPDITSYKLERPPQFYGVDDKQQIIDYLMRPHDPMKDQSRVTIGNPAGPWQSQQPHKAPFSWPVVPSR